MTELRFAGIEATLADKEVDLVSPARFERTEGTSFSVSSGRPMGDGWCEGSGEVLEGDATTGLSKTWEQVNIGPNSVK